MASFSKKMGNVVRFLNNTDGSLQKQVVRSGFWVGISSVAVISLTLVRSIVLARLLVPEVFGLMGICMVVIRGAEVFSKPGFAAALIQSQDSFQDSKDTAFTLLILRGLALAVICIFSAPLVAVYYECESLDILLKVLAISFIFKGFKNINTVKFAKGLDFKRLSYLDQSMAVLNTVITITLAYFLRSIWALVIGYVSAAFVGTLMSFVIIRGRVRLRFDQGVAKELFHYGKFITGLSVLLFFASEIDKAVIGKLLGMELLGYYTIAFTLANLPVTHISRVVSSVMFPAYSKLQTDLPALRAAYLKTLRFVCMIVMPAGGGMIILAPDLIRVVYGPKWLPAVSALQILAVFGILRALNSLSGYLFNGIGKPNIAFYLNLVRLILIVPLLYPLTVRFQLIGASIAVAAPMAAHFFAGIYLLRRSIGIGLREVAKVLCSSAGNTFVMIAVLFLARYVVPADSIYGLGFLVLLGIFTFAVLNISTILTLAKNRRRLFA